MPSIFDAICDVEKELEDTVKSSAIKSVVSISQMQGVFSGQLSASNNIGIGQPDLSRIDVVNYTKGAISGMISLSKSAAESKLKNFVLGDDLHITNNHEYAIFDEFKHGRLSYTITFDKIKGWIESVSK